MTWPRMFAGSCAVYVVMAACSGSDSAKLLAVDSDASAGGVAAVEHTDASRMIVGSLEGDGSIDIDAGLIDRISSPVEDAAAQDSGLSSGAFIVTLGCNVSHDGAAWAVLDMPGRTAESLAGVRVLAELVASEIPSAPFAVTHAPVAYNSWVVVGDGKLGVQCGCVGCDPVYSSVTFYVP